jgi:His-Xaa-Ser system radical SAM maturase HxsB
MRVELFRSPEHYRPPAPNGYRLLPFRFMRWDGTDLLVTNEAGEFTFLSTSEFERFVSGGLDPRSTTFRTLKSKHFLTDTGLEVPIALLATKYRTKMAFLDGFTKLHLFVVTLRCDHSCPYCQVSRVNADRTRFDMSRDTAERAVALMFQSPSPDLKVEFQGGESLLNTELIAFVVQQVAERNRSENRAIDFVIATNLAELSDDVLALCQENRIHLSTSLDGPSWLHNANRPRPGGDSYERTIRHIAKARAILGHDSVSALMTTTERSLSHPREIVDEYVAQGLDHIFLRPISPYGFAVRTKAAFKYQTARFLDFYRTALDHIIEVNRRGTPFMEIYAQIVLQKVTG